eukprot:945819-Amphidinium_carterae.2
MAGEGRWLALHVLTAQRERQELVFKGNNKSLKLGKVLSKDLSDAVAGMGGFDGPHLTRSRRASGHTDTSQEYTASTYGLLRLLLWFSYRRRYHADQQRGKALVTSFLSACLPAEHNPQPSPNFPLEMRAQCQVHVSGEGCCEHLMHCIEVAGVPSPDMPPQVITVNWVHALASMESKCAACKAILDCVTQEASSVIDTVALVGDLASEDVKESVRGRQVQHQKRRRIDEHVRAQ